jgi:hypothetical protein
MTPRFRSERLPIGLRPRRGLGWPWKSLEARDGEVVDNLRSGCAQVDNRPFKKGGDTLIGAVLQPQGLAEDAETRAFQAVPVEESRVASRNVRLGRRSACVGLIDAVTSSKRATSSTLRPIGPGVSR